MIKSAYPGYVKGWGKRKHFDNELFRGCQHFHMPVHCRSSPSKAERCPSFSTRCAVRAALLSVSENTAQQQCKPARRWSCVYVCMRKECFPVSKPSSQWQIASRLLALGSILSNFEAIRLSAPILSPLHPPSPCMPLSPAGFVELKLCSACLMSSITRRSNEQKSLFPSPHSPSRWPAYLFTMPGPTRPCSKRGGEGGEEGGRTLDYLFE